MTLRLDRLAPAVRAKAEPLLLDLERVCGPALHSLHVTGSAVTPDWVPGASDVNTLVMLQGMDLAVLEAIAPLGKRHRGKGLAPPLVLDTAYVHRSLDVFPIEFLELRLVHETVLGEDLLGALPILRKDLRHQCEREVKARLVALRQGYLGTLGEAKPLREALLRFLAGFVPLARGILSLLGKETPVPRAAALALLAGAAGLEPGVFTDLLALREGRLDPGGDGLRALFERCYGATERLGQIVDELPA